MRQVLSLPWQQAGASLLAPVTLDFSIDTTWEIFLGGSLGSDYYQALSVDVNAYQLTPGSTMTLTRNSVPEVLIPGVFHTYNLAQHQPTIRIVSSVGSGECGLVFYPKERREWR